MKLVEIIKFSILCAAVVISYSVGNFSLLDELLLIYIGAAFLFRWSGGLIIGIGLIMQLLVTLSRYNNRHDLSLIAGYPVWLIGSGIVLLLLPRMQSMVLLWRQNKNQRRVFFQELRMQGRASLTQRHAFFQQLWMQGRASLIRSYGFAVQAAYKTYQQWFGRFPGHVRMRIILSLIALPVLFVSTSWAVDAIFLTAICFWLMLFVRDSRIPVAAAGLSFIAAAIFVAARMRPFADVLIVYGYYFLWMIVLVEVKRFFMHYWHTRGRNASHS